MTRLPKKIIKFIDIKLLNCKTIKKICENLCDLWEKIFLLLVSQNTHKCSVFEVVIRSHTSPFVRKAVLPSCNIQVPNKFRTITSLNCHPRGHQIHFSFLVVVVPRRIVFGFQSWIEVDMG